MNALIENEVDYLAHKIELIPKPKQEAFFRQCCGAARFFWNRSLAGWKEQYETGEKLNEAKFRKATTADKKNCEELAWANEIPAAAIDNSIRNLGVAFKNFFEKIKKGKKEGYPKFKSKHGKQSFNPWCGGRIALNGDRIRIPNLGWVRMRECLRFEGRIASGVVSQRAGKWFVSITVEIESPKKERTGNKSVGIDLGCKDMAVLSNGEKHPGPKPLRLLMKKLQRLSKSLSRKVNGSKNRAKAKLKISKLHYRIANIRSAYQHELTTKLVLDCKNIAIEDLSVKSMAGLESIRKSLMDQMLGEFRRKLEYKSKLYGSEIHIVDRYFPSSKTCSCCGNVKDELSLSDRIYNCEHCGLSLDRDINAAINLLKQIPMLDRELTPMESSSLESLRSRNLNCGVVNATI